MITYENGTPMLVGDSVCVEQGRTPATIIQVIEDATELQQWNLAERGIMIKSQQLGMVFIPISSFAADPIVFVSRNKL
jgi:hypothetical protein